MLLYVCLILTLLQLLRGVHALGVWYLIFWRATRDHAPHFLLWNPQAPELELAVEGQLGRGRFGRRNRGEPLRESAC